MLPRVIVGLRTSKGIGFKTFYTAKGTLLGVELVHMIRKGQIRPLHDGTDAEQFRALAA